MPVNAEVNHFDGMQDSEASRASTALMKTDTTVKQLPAEHYDAFLTEKAKTRMPSAIREILPLEQTPGIISFLSGKPNPVSFPITAVHLTIRNAADPTDAPGTPLTLEKDALAEGLQYGHTMGYRPLLHWLFGFQKHFHGRSQGEGWRISMGSGAQDLLYKVFNAVLAEGDSILVETPVYTGILPILRYIGASIIPVEADEDGLKPSSLKDLLEKWPASKPHPRFLYHVPYGSNPTGVTTTEARRRDILALAVQYNFLILEDDPYYFLYYGTRPRPRSYFSLELEQPEVGRVIRLDSFSKVFSSGMRIGFISGPEPLLDAIDKHTASANEQVSTFTQVITYTVLKTWGYDQFWKHTVAISQFYRKRRDMFWEALNRNLNGLVDCSPPDAGMFFWFRLKLKDGANDSETIIRNNAFKNGVLALPGTSFMPDGSKTAYVRASFSLLEPEVVEEALKRLRKVILEVRGEQEQQRLETIADS